MTSYKFCAACAEPTPHVDLHCQRCGAAWQPPSPPSPAPPAAGQGQAAAPGAGQPAKRFQRGLVWPAIVVVTIVLTLIGTLPHYLVSRIDADLRRIQEQQSVRSVDKDHQRDDDQDVDDDDDDLDDDDDIASGASGASVSVAARVVVDAPAAGQRLTDPLWISGWAANPAATDGTGVDAVSIWLTEGGAGNIAVLGDARYGLARPDLAAALGGERFDHAGFGFSWDAVATELPPGSYALVVGARFGATWVTNTVPITIPRKQWQDAFAASGLPPTESVTLDGVAFQKLETERATLYYQKGVGPAKVAWVAHAVERAIDQVPELMNLPGPGDRIAVYLFASWDTLKRDSATMEGGANRLAFVGGWYQSSRFRHPGIYLNADTFFTEAYTATAVTHEYVHHVIHAADGSNEIGAWLNEGLADTISEQLVRRQFPEEIDREQQRRLQTVARAAAAGTLQRLDRLENYDSYADKSARRAEERTLLYAEGTLAVQMLARDHGLTAVTAVPARITERRSWKTAFAGALNQSTAAFDQAFTESLPALYPAVVPAQAAVGQRVSFVATGYKKYERVVMEIQQPGGAALRLPAGAADDRGIVSASLRVLPGSPTGRWQVTLAGGQGGRATVTFTVGEP